MLDGNPTVAEEVFVNCDNFNLIRLKHASFHVRKVLVLKSKKVIFEEPYETIRSWSWSRSRSREP
jgi:hypothetical protein